MDKETRRRKFLEFTDGLRNYIKHQSHGKFNGKYLAENWKDLSESEQDTLIARAFVLNSEMIITMAHQAIQEE